MAASLSQVIGQSIILFASRVKTVRFVLSLLVGAITNIDIERSLHKDLNSTKILAFTQKLGLRLGIEVLPPNLLVDVINFEASRYRSLYH